MQQDFSTASACPSPTSLTPYPAPSPMKMSSMPADSLPEPSPEAREHSARLAAFIRSQIGAAGGAIPFSRFMELALYSPGLGYYSAGSRKFGADGDFVTAPELGSVFAQCVAHSLAPVLRGLGGETSFFELGGGSGLFAAAALRQLAVLDALPTHYLLLEPSADLRSEEHTSELQSQSNL